MLPRLLLPAILICLVAGAAAAAPPKLKTFGSVCLESTLEDCTVVEAGFVTPGRAFALAYQLQSGTDEYGGIGGGAVLFAQNASGWDLWGTDFAGASYTTPNLSEADETLFHIPGYAAGTSVANADILLQYGPDDTSWHRVDIDSWWEALEREMPEGLTIVKGVAYDLGKTERGKYVAQASLWTETDANCCPSGGKAEIHFAIEDHALKLVDVIFSAPKAE